MGTQLPAHLGHPKRETGAPLVHRVPWMPALPIPRELSQREPVPARGRLLRFGLARAGLGPPLGPHTRPRLVFLRLAGGPE